MMTCSKCGEVMGYVKTVHIPHDGGFVERTDIWQCPKCGPKTDALNTIEALMNQAGEE